MSTEIKRRRGTTFEHATFTGALGELTVDTDKDTVVVHDGATAGGIPLSKSAHTHTADEILGGAGFVIAVSAGGTGASTAASALTNLGGASLLHVHESQDILGFGSTIRYVDSSAQFASAYAGSSKTIVLAANSYTTPTPFLSSINLIHFGDPRDVVLSGNGNLTASSVQLVFQGITIDGDITITGSNASLRFNNVIHASGQISISAAGTTLDVKGGEIANYFVTEGTLNTWDTKITDGTSNQTGGTVLHRDLLAEVNDAAQIIQASSRAQDTRIVFVGASLFVSTALPATHWMLRTPEDTFYVWYSVAGLATDPAASTRGIGTGLNINTLTTTSTAASVATATASTINTAGSFTATASANTVLITNTIGGSTVIASDVNASLVSISATIVGTDATLGIDGIRFKNPAGGGIRIVGGATGTLDGVVATGSILTNGLVVDNRGTLILGTHNMTAASDADLVVTGSGTVVAMNHPLPIQSISALNIQTGAIAGSHIAGSAVGRFNVRGALKQQEHQIFLPIVAATTTGLKFPVAGSANSVNQTIIHHNFQYSGFLRQVIIEPVAGAAVSSGSNMDISLIRYAPRTVGGSTFAQASQLVMVSSINIGEGPTIIDTSTLGQRSASLLGVGSPLVGFAVSAGNASTISGGGFTLLVSTINGGSTMENIMVSYVLQIDRS